MLRQNVLQRFSWQGTGCACDWFDVLVSVIVVDRCTPTTRLMSRSRRCTCAPECMYLLAPCIRVCTVYICTHSHRVHLLFMLYRNVCKRDNIKSNYPLSWSCCMLWRVFNYATSVTGVLLRQNDRSWATQPTLDILPRHWLIDAHVLLATDLYIHHVISCVIKGQNMDVEHTVHTLQCRDPSHVDHAPPPKKTGHF